MRFSPKKIEENVNVSKTHPLREFALLLGGLTAFIVGIYLILGVAVDWIVPHISPEFERKIIALISFDEKLEGKKKNKKKQKAKSKEQEYLQFVSNKLYLNAKDVAIKPKIVFKNSSTVNAFAYPNGEIVMYKGLLDRLNNENEVAFIIAHEMGHYGHKHHLKSLGRGMVLLMVSSSLFGLDNPLNNLITQFLNTTEKQFSQSQEEQADLYALNLLEKTYGHVGGSVNSLEAILKDRKSNEVVYFFSTHPFPKKRLKRLKTIIENGNYAVKN